MSPRVDADDANAATCDLSEMRVQVIGNGYIIHVIGAWGARTYVIQSENDDADDFEKVLNALREAYYNARGWNAKQRKSPH